jgi:DNA-binding NtrC family response regulator
MQKLREQVQQVAAHEAPVMLVGEPGTGREASCALHAFARAARRRGFRRVTCASLDDTNAADKLRGVASGGKSEPGLFEQARGGTLFLGGVEDLTPNAQRLLLADSGSTAGNARARPRSLPFEARFITGRSPGTTVLRAGSGAT